MNTLSDQWSMFERHVLAGVVNPVQRREMQRAFYAGAKAALDLMTKSVPDQSDDAGVAMIQFWLDELEAFGQSVLRGEA